MSAARPTASVPVAQAVTGQSDGPSAPASMPTAAAAAFGITAGER